MAEKFQPSDDPWRDQLTPEQYAIARQGGTERAFTGEYYATNSPGRYRCVCCAEILFESSTKYDSGSGWPSFKAPAAPEAVEIRTDPSHGMVRREVICRRCAAHLGHVFPDGPRPGGLRFCINSACLTLEPEPEPEPQPQPEPQPEET